MISDTDTIRHLSFHYGKLKIDHFAHPAFKLLVAHTNPRKPAIGGLRRRQIHHYTEALVEVCGLAETMDRKEHVAGFKPAAGVKGLIYGYDQELWDRMWAAGDHGLLHMVAECVNHLEGTWICSVDMNITVPHVAAIREKTPFASEGDPSPRTADGVVSANIAFLEWLKQRNKLKGQPSVYISGLGAVGFRVAELLLKEGVLVYGWDTTTDRAKLEAIKKLGVILLPDDRFPHVHVIAPCAMGDFINETTVPLILQAKIPGVIGSGNRLVAKESDAFDLHRGGTLLCPDHWSSMGGVLFVGDQFRFVTNYKEKIRGIGSRVIRLFEESLERGLPPVVIAEEMYQKQLRQEADMSTAA